MKLTAYALHDDAVILRPASTAHPQMTKNAAGLPLGAANTEGWELLCPHAFEVLWNGGPAPEDITIRMDAPERKGPSFVQSQLGGGLLTFHPGYQVQIDGANHLWIRGPVNEPKDALSAVEQLVDTSVVPYTIIAHWKCLRPNQWIRFEKGETFAVLLPYPKQFSQRFRADVLKPEETQVVYAQELQQRIQGAAVKELVERLRQGAPQQKNTAKRIKSPSPVAIVAPRVAVSAPSATNTMPKPLLSWAERISEAPPISCICPTYGRAELLEEAIQSFLQQDYPGPKELVILNDYAEQTLQFDHPEVRIVNVAERYPTLGEKFRAAVDLASHDLLCVWHDDDIYLPHRLSLTVAQFHSKHGFFRASHAWTLENGELVGPESNVFHGGACFSRELYVAAQGYPQKNEDFDAQFEHACEDQRPGVTYGKPLTLQDLYYIHRWGGTDSYHVTARSANGNGYEAARVYVQAQAARGRIPSGRITLQPQWKDDYAALVRDHIESGRAEEDQAVVFPPPYFEIPGPAPLPEAEVAALFKGTHPLKISVILPALNESVLLQRTVEQFEKTLPPDCEIIVVDNGSIDGCADFLRNGHHPLVHLIESPKPLGVSGARNRGLESARGEVVVFADSHVDIPERWWQPVVATLNRPNVGVVGPGIGVMGKREKKVTYGQRIAESSLRLEWLPWKQNDPHQVPTLGGGFVAMRHETLKQAGTFDAGMPQWGSEDLELCLRYWLLGYEVWVVPEVVILHYFRTQNPLRIKPGIVTHNQLRVALLHLDKVRLERVLGALKNERDFDTAMAHAVDSDVWQRRAEFAARRVRDSNWYFESFKESCLV